jgi:hypothetical protein
MKIVVVGGSGLVGSKLVSLLRTRGHQVVAASPDTGVNTLTGEGLAAALAGSQVVVDVANSPSTEDKAAMDFFETSGRNLLAAEEVAGVKHHVALSVIGAERLPESGYLRAKVAQEKLIRASGIPYTILHSTQFFEFIHGLVEAGADGDAIRIAPAFVPRSSSSSTKKGQLRSGPPRHRRQRRARSNDEKPATHRETGFSLDAHQRAIIRLLTSTPNQRLWQKALSAPGCLRPT